MKYINGYIIIVVMLMLLSSGVYVLGYVIQYYSDPVTPTRKMYRPLIGGIQATTEIDNSLAYSTIGYSAKLGGSMMGVVVVSHAIDDDVDIAPVYQPIYGDRYLIGYSLVTCSTCDIAFIYTLGNLYGEVDVSPYILHVIRIDDDTYLAVNAAVIGWYDWDTLNFLYNIGITEIYRTDRSSGTSSMNIINLSEEYNYKDLHLEYVVAYDNSGLPGSSGAPLYYYYDEGMGSNAEAAIIGHHVGGSSTANIGLGVTMECVIQNTDIRPLTTSALSR